MKRKRLLWILLGSILAGAAVLVIGIVQSRSLQVTAYTAALEGLSGDIRLVLLSDLHAKEYGENNTELLELVRQQEPDLICLVGDMFDRDSTQAEIEQVAQFADALSKIAPTYYSFGNHEESYLEKNGGILPACFAQTGVTILNGDYLDLTINGSTIRLGGLDRYAYRNGANEFDPDAERFLREFCDTDLPTVLLSHRPEFFSFKSACAEWDVDLILSGHTHGGLVRLPLIGGLYAPIQGWLPKVSYGEYTFFNSRMIVTSGLSGYDNLPRVFNPPEICVITLTNSQ